MYRSPSVHIPFDRQDDWLEGIDGLQHARALNVVRFAWDAVVDGRVGIDNREFPD